MSQKTSIKAHFIKPLTLAETGGAPFIKAKLAAEATGLGVTVISRIGTRRFGNTDYASVAAINAFIAGPARSESPQPPSQTHPAANSSDAKPPTASTSPDNPSSKLPSLLKKAAGEEEQQVPQTIGEQK